MNIRKILYRILIHIVGWVLLFILPPLIMHAAIKLPNNFGDIMNWILVITFFYINYLWLVPNFLSRRRFIVYFTGIFLMLATCYFSTEIYVRHKYRVEVARGEGVERAKNPRIHHKPPRFRGYFSSLFCFAILALGTSIRVTEGWYINEKQKKEMENQKLGAELSLLKSQINPHFFFNSLNSLSSLVRDRRNENALRYIDELSNTYRYAMQSSGKELVAVTEELESLKAYSYLLGIRFEDKLFFEINIDDNALNMLLPVLSLQPLIENVVKHNVISTESPLTITIAGNREGITVMNPKRPRNTSGEKSGIGLNNLSTRYKLLTGKDLLIENGVYIFSVTLPLIIPDDV